MTPPLQFERVHKAFVRPDAGYGIVANVSLAVDPGACVSLVGENGSGKSTILRMACGLVRPDGGLVRLWGGDPIHDGGARARVAAVFDAALYGRLTPRENLDYFAAVKGIDGAAARARFDRLAARFDIAAYAAVAVRKLSRGTRQKFVLLCGLAGGADLWLLDEPTLGLDAGSAVVLADIMRAHLRGGGAVLMATHDLRLADALGTVVQVADFMPQGWAPRRAPSVA